MSRGESASPVHLRRCHLCGGTSVQSRAPVHRCQSCGKPFAPFYYFDDVHKPILSDCQLRPTDLEGLYRPIQGLTVYWETF